MCLKERKVYAMSGCFEEAFSLVGFSALEKSSSSCAEPPCNEALQRYYGNQS
ncbi:hypothetical protein FOPG_19777 [Fusarium oxysporum f. sp. conglutinans race 2 54008]|uniref:Uncharacterized protein n=1 Tax=Fusarium oxysporum f. sp. conglutinans race 2 54008 TaxID=1089457 RepID=X0GKX1_FUSOX|nr:hypothetical protein FOPG_19777 [Fusarium oxysporum f. sp. conglutinans race 2 54008]